jgi:outer membrane protein OmpA-like peptidoglycan-associated protein
MLLALAACSSPPAPTPVAFNPPPQTMGARDADIRWFHVRFDTGGARIGPEQQSTVEAAGAAMRSDPALRATVIGRTDTAGGDQANLRLSRARATAVRDALVRNERIPSQRIDVRWTGDRRQSTVDVRFRGDADDRVVDIGLR